MINLVTTNVTVPWPSPRYELLFKQSQYVICMENYLLNNVDFNAWRSTRISMLEGQVLHFLKFAYAIFAKSMWQTEASDSLADAAWLPWAFHRCVERSQYKRCKSKPS